MSRPPSPPPVLPGFRYLEPLGTGGFADVFLYEQEMPRRQVAVKVLLADRISSTAAQEFADEANVMAMLSTHPAIVTIYQAGVAGDGRPYLVMEYCPRPNLQLRARRESFSVAEALRVGVQVAGAVETAHRAGVLHRDIKPANILVTAYNRPALTDFGIASTTGATGEASGMSIPWSPPESFAETPTSGPRTDVWALGATLYTLLAGRSPFERPGERNSSADLIERIERAALTSLGRPDSPESLQRVLERAMAKNPDDRYPSAVAFARALQKVQIELSHSVTPIDIVDDHPTAEDLDDDGDGLTRVREIVSIDPDVSAFTRPSAATQPKSSLPALPDVPRFDSPASAGAVDEATQMRVPTVGMPPAPAAPTPDDRTIVRPPMVVAPHAPASVVPALASPPGPPVSPAAGAPALANPKNRRGLWIALSAVAAVIVVVGTIVGLNALVAGIETTPEATESADPQDVVSDFVPKVADLSGARQGELIVFTWLNKDPQEGDTFIWEVVDVSGQGEPQQAEDAVAQLPASAGTVCIDVMLRRDDGRVSERVRGCVD
ncbi:serine/threonine-protein kinase [Microbacterium sp. SA39]|uniref:serine/threonine-protein kinase n=1 Tax=Microbacterium sp. SA39 TaxID=1263625 RepID=UPI0005FA6F97|nr:serine/threonine-protein kinase [Microbacterium sp. SA39]KJQ53304.1 Serine/threonine-protein kinase PknK [Microbacterium sp. SA39]